MLWVALHLPALSLESWQAALAATTGATDATDAADTAGAGGAADAPGSPAAAPPRPLALLASPPAPNRIALVDRRALACGVQPGMGRATALALAPELQLGQADARRDAEALRAVAHVALAFSPSVTWATPADWRPSPEEAALAPPQPAACPALVGVRLEVGSCLRYHGGLASLLARLRAQLAPLGHGLRIATAPTALGAALLAAWRDDLAQGPHSTRLQAMQALLDTLPLALLVSDAAQAEALQGMGLHRLADLARLPRDGLARRFGPALLRALDQASGRQPEAQRWLLLPQQFATRLELCHRADNSAQVLHGARLLLARLVVWLQARQVRAVRFTLLLHHEPRHRHHDDRATPAHSALEIAPAQPSADAGHLAVLLAERLGRWPLPAPALELSLRCDQVLAGGPPSGELFASPGSQREGLARLVERLQARLGRAQVLRPVPVADRRPGRSTAWLPADAARLQADPAGALADPATACDALPPQPLWLLPTPQPLTWPAEAPLPLHQGQPLQLLAGPERLETGWWDAEPMRCDYFIARAADGALLWVYHCRGKVAGAEDAPDAARREAGGWFLHGRFA